MAKARHFELADPFKGVPTTITLLVRFNNEIDIRIRKIRTITPTFQVLYAT